MREGALAATLLPVAVGEVEGGLDRRACSTGSRRPCVLALAAAYAAVTILLVAAALAAASGNARMAVAGLVGALAAVFTLPEIEAFTRGFVLSALPATAAKVLTLVSFTAGLALSRRPSRPWPTSFVTTRCDGGCWPRRLTGAR